MGLVWPEDGPATGWLTITRGTGGPPPAGCVDLAELRMAIARAAGLAAGSFMSRERVGPSGAEKPDNKVIF